MTNFDVLIVGAGLSGIGAGAHLRMNCPGKSFAILEGRSASGGTWDLFRYPGVRSDSDMYTLGYRFRPWQDAKAIADGPAILEYIRETAAEYDLEKEIRYEHRVRQASWSTQNAVWTVQIDTGNGSKPKELTCNFLYLCTGYYDYDKGYTPEWQGSEQYRGQIVHPQHWPQNLDYSGKHVVVIGSGATAVTLVPAMAETAAHVTMLQRSPTYVMTLPSEDRIANFLRRRLPVKMAHAITRWKNVLLQMFFYGLSRRRPETMKRLIAKGVRTELGGDENLSHFTPTYNPWDQRLCLVPDSDLFRVIRNGGATVVTDEIERFTKTGLVLRSGATLDADIIVTATGLVLKMMSGLELSVDGSTVDLSKTITYKGMMYSDVPNLVSAFGYTNASWTLKCDLTAEYACRLLNHMDRYGFDSCTPVFSDPSIPREPVLDFKSGYVQRAIHTLPSQGSRAPWRLYQNYILDLTSLRYGNVEDGVMRFETAPARDRNQVS